MTTRSVTRAAERLGLGQPAVSHALARLRDVTGDALFVSSRHGLVPTSRALLAIAGWIRSVLEQAQQKLLEPAPFNPAEWTGTIRLSMTPKMDMLLMPRLLAHLAAQAPHVRVVVYAAPIWHGVIGQLDDGAVDLYVGFTGELKAWHRQRTLWKENLLALFSSKQLRLSLPLTLDSYLSCSHVLVTQQRGTWERQVDDVLAQMGHQRRIVLTTPHFFVIPQLLLDAPLIATMHGRAAQWFRRAFNLRTS